MCRMAAGSFVLGAVMMLTCSMVVCSAPELEGWVTQQDRLKQSATRDFEDVPLWRLMHHLFKDYQLNLVLDETTVSYDTRVIVRAKDAPIGEGLRRALEPRGLGYRAERNVIWISSLDKANGKEWVLFSSKLNPDIDAEFAARLQEPIDLNFVNADVASVLRYLAMVNAVPIEIDVMAMEPSGDTTKPPSLDPGKGKVTIQISRVPFEEALEAVLRQKGLLYTIREGWIRIVHPETLRQFGLRLEGGRASGR